MFVARSIGDTAFRTLPNGDRMVSASPATEPAVLAASLPTDHAPEYLSSELQSGASPVYAPIPSWMP